MSRDFDVLIATDFRYSGGTTASLRQEIEIQARMGLRTGLMQIDTRYLSAFPMAERIRNLVGVGLAEFVSPQQAVTARLLVLRHPKVFEQDAWRMSVRADRVVMVANQVPRDDARPEPYYDPAKVVDRLAHELKTAPEWSPIGPMVRDSLLAHGGGRIEITPFDWHNVINAEAWIPRHPRERRRKPVIGRHSRDDVKKWPEDRAQLLGVYPDSPDRPVRILGGAASVEKILGRPALFWDVLPFGSVAPEEFLQSLDLYVYFHHSGMREAFGRAPLEALAAGLPVLTHRYLERVFGDVCRYCEPAEGPEIIREMLRDSGVVNQRGIELVRERYDWEEHRRRLSSYLPQKASPIARASSRHRVLFISSNGGGMGHLTRLLSMARRLPEGVDPMFLTMSTGIEAVRREGYWVDYMPGPDAGELTATAWLGYLEQRVTNALRTLKPAVVVFDGTVVYQGLPQALAKFPHVFSIWSRRGMWKPVSPERWKQAVAHSRLFNLVVEPGELASAVDQGFTAQNRDGVAAVPPIVYFEPDELLERDVARAELGIRPGATAALINLGAGNINRLDAVYDAIGHALGKHPDLELFAVQSLIAKRGVPVDADRVRRLQIYPLSRFLQAFDFCVAAPGYNSFHELLANRVPTLFIPNEQTALDDQFARARWASDEGVAFMSREEDAAELERVFAELMRPEVRAGLRERMARLPACDGARRAAALIALHADKADKAVAARAPASDTPVDAEPAAPAPALAEIEVVRSQGRRSALVRYPYAVWRPVRRLRRRMRNAIWQARRDALERSKERARLKRALETLERRKEREVAAAEAAAAETAAEAARPTPGRLLVVAKETPGESAIQELAAWASTHPRGAVILAGPAAVPALRRHGLTVELFLQVAARDVDERLELASYWKEKARVLRAAYQCRRVLFWGETDVDEQAQLLRLLGD